MEIATNELKKFQVMLRRKLPRNLKKIQKKRKNLANPKSLKKTKINILAKRIKMVVKRRSKIYKKEEEKELDIDFGNTYSLKTFNLNLGNALENRFVRIEVSLEYSSGTNHRK